MNDLKENLKKDTNFLSMENFFLLEKSSKYVQKLSGGTISTAS